MARKAVIERELKKIKAVQKYAEKRISLKKKIVDLSLSDEERWEAQQAFQSLPRNASPSRVTKRCRRSGRPHGVYRKFGLSRGKLRKFGMFGLVPGLRKASW